MTRFKNIASRGWLGSAKNVLTFGYYPSAFITNRYLSLRDRGFGLTLRGRL